MNYIHKSVILFNLVKAGNKSQTNNFEMFYFIANFTNHLVNTATLLMSVYI